MYAPRAKFERVYVVSPIKVAVVFFVILHALAIFITLLTSFWIETRVGHYGPLYRCEKYLIQEKLHRYVFLTIQCHLGGFLYDFQLFTIPLTAILLIISILLSIVSVLTANFSFMKSTSTIRYRYWLSTTLLLLIICLIDCFVVVFLPLSYQREDFVLQWAYGLHCGATLFISVSLITAILSHHLDDVQYIERIEESPSNS